MLEVFFLSLSLSLKYLQGYVPVNNGCIVLKWFYQSVTERHKILPQTLYIFFLSIIVMRNYVTETINISFIACIIASTWESIHQFTEGIEALNIESQ